MPSASASGADASNGQARNREHNQGNQDRKCTPEQKAAVLRIRRCQPTAFYEILEIEKSATDGQIKKAYRRLSLMTHPDKNGHEGADEAFKSRFCPSITHLRFVLEKLFCFSMDAAEKMADIILSDLARVSNTIRFR